MNSGLFFVLGCGVVSFLLLRGAFWLYRYDKREREELNKLGRMGTPPTSFTIKGDPSRFSISVLMLCGFVAAVFAFGFVLRRATITFTPGFVLGVLLIGTLVLWELWGTLVVFCTFFKGQLRVEGTQLVRVDWLGRTNTFDVQDVIAYRPGRGRVRIGCFIGSYSTLRYKDRRGVEHLARFCVTEYTGILLSRYLVHNGVVITAGRW